MRAWKLGIWVTVGLALRVQASPAPAPSGLRAGPPCGAATTDPQVIDAMYSVFLAVTRDVWQAQGVTPPVRGRAVKLVDAVEAVRCDGNTARKRGRQRYAITKLAAGAVLMRRARNDAAAERYERALEQLGVDDVLLERLRRSSAHDLAGLEDEAGVIIDAEPALCVFQRSCCACITDCTAGKSGDTAGVAFSIRVDRDPRENSCVVDPLTWPTVAPGHFKRVFFLDTPACSGTDPQCRSSTGPCPPGAAPVEGSNQPTPGSTWCGLVYEQFETQAANTTAKFENVLRVRMDFTPDDASTPTDETATRMRYGLCEAVSYEIGGGPQPCGLELDCGEASIRASGASSGGGRFAGTKSVRFRKDLPEDPNGWAPIALELLVKESALASCLAGCGGAGGPPPNEGCPAADEKCGCPGDSCYQTPLPFKPPAADYCPP